MIAEEETFELFYLAATSTYLFPSHLSFALHTPTFLPLGYNSCSSISPVSKRTRRYQPVRITIGEKYSSLILSGLPTLSCLLILCHFTNTLRSHSFHRKSLRRLSWTPGGMRMRERERERGPHNGYSDIESIYSPAAMVCSTRYLFSLSLSLSLSLSTLEKETLVPFLQLSKVTTRGSSMQEFLGIASTVR